jgi:hypothetical protein
MHQFYQLGFHYYNLAHLLQLYNLKIFHNYLHSSQQL